MSPKISIIIPCFNHGHYIRDAIQSAEKCSDKDLYEIIILNDGSTAESTIEVMRQLAEEGYNVINQHNMGLGAARNNAIKKAKGIYILPLDSDNKIRPEYIYESVKILDEQPAIAMVYGDAEYFGEETGRHSVGNFNLQKIMLGNYIDACAVYRKSVWEALGGYDEKMPVIGLEDWDLWLNMAFNNYSFYYINKVLFDYKVIKNSMLRSLNNTDKQATGKYLQSKYNKYLDYNFINDLILHDVKKNKKLILKLILATYIPSSLNYLERKKIIKDKKFFL